MKEIGSEAIYDPKRINASPTKEFFIYMLTRDIPLTRAILDLVDNSADGARRIRPTSDYINLWVRLEVSADHFRIADNCGGMPVNMARNYAFRFGRPNDAPLTPGSVGQFGVGMKRAFFKLGEYFRVTSTTDNSRFNMEIDVLDWVMPNDNESPEDWHFHFDTVEEGLTGVQPLDVGTQIEVTRLHRTVAENFELDNFVTRLTQEISVAHSATMNKGLAISVNGIPIGFEPQRLFVSDQLQPAYLERVYARELIDGQTGAPVKVKLYAGIGERSLHEGGWYLFCNGRLVLRADQTTTTVWGPTHGMRQYHPDFAYFRGYVYFDSDNASLLPWTTTKTGVDVDSPIYKHAQQEMIEISKPVLAFLSSLSKEKAAIEAGESTDRSLQSAIEGATAQITEQVLPTPAFVAPKIQLPPTGPKMQKIQYTKPLTEVEKAKRLLKVYTFTAVGEKTFEYFLQYEGDDQ